MNFCPKCRKRLVVQDFCVECGADLSEYTQKAASDGFDFAALEQEANRQLMEQSGLQIEGQVLVKYTGKSREVAIPQGVTEIFDGAFAKNEIIGSVEIPEGVRFIGKGAFEGCRHLKTVSLPSTLEEIYENAFMSCSELETVIIPEGIRQIRQQVFRYCSSLKSIHIPASVQQIGYMAFDGCNKLAEIFLADVAAWCGITDLRNLMEKTGVKQLYLHGQPLTHLTIPESVTAIGSFAFCGCGGITQVEIHGGVVSVGDQAFCGTGLQELTLPASLTALGRKAFGACKNLQSVTTFANILGVSSSDAVFADCPNMIRFTAGKGVTEIGSYALSGCTRLTHVEIANSVTTIGAGAFMGCGGLRSIEVPKSVTFIGPAAFKDCNSLVEISLPFVGESRTATDKAGVFGYIFGCTSSRPDNTPAAQQYQQTQTVWGDTKTYYYYYFIPESLRRVTITDTTVIGNYAFHDCGQLTSITIPNKVTSIGDSAFGSCRGLKSIDLPDALTTIGNAAFHLCAGLTDITIPERVTSIGATAFFGCSGLERIYIPAEVKTIGASAFVAGAWSNMPVGLTAVDVSSYNDHYKSVGGVLYSKDGKQLLCYPPGKTDTRFTVPGSVTSIADGAFRGCVHLTSLVIPNSVEYIGTSALQGCWNLTSLTLPFVGTRKPTSNAGEHFGSIFSGCNDERGVPPKLQSVTVTGSTYIPDYAFSSCRNLQSVSLNYGVVSIGREAFFWCKSITRIDIPSSVTSIGSVAFCGCQALTELSIPASVRQIADDIFVNCNSITVRTSASIAGRIHTSGSGSIRFIT